MNRDELVENLSSELHDIYIKEAKRQGDVRHKDKYAELPENIKEFDRVLARFILADRKRIVEPLVKVTKMTFEDNLSGDFLKCNAWNKAIDETIKLAGINEKEN